MAAAGAAWQGARVEWMEWPSIQRTRGRGRRGKEMEVLPFEFARSLAHSQVVWCSFTKALKFTRTGKDF